MGKVISIEERRKARGIMRSFIGFIPNLLKLLYRLLRDARVSGTDKAILVGTIIYVLTPIDLIPDIFPFLGQVDDLYAVAIAILRLINNSSRDVVDSHWDGGGDIKQIASTITDLSQFFLPVRVRKILTGRTAEPVVANFDEYARSRSED